MIKKKKQKNFVSLYTNLYCAFWNVIVIFIHYINLKRSSFRGFYLACSTMIVLTPQTTELTVCLCQIRTMKMICIWHPMWERPWPRLHLIPCPKYLLSNSMMLWVPRYHYQHRPSAQSSRNIIYSSFLSK